jgi:hypothetical protein
MEEIKKTYPRRESNTDYSAIQLAARRYTD